MLAWSEVSGWPFAHIAMRMESLFRLGAFNMRLGDEAYAM